MDTFSCNQTASLLDATSGLAPLVGALRDRFDAEWRLPNDLVQAIGDAAAWSMLLAERACVARLDASCNTPLGAHATIGDAGIVMRTFAGLPDGSAWLRDETPPVPTPVMIASIGVSAKSRRIS